MRASTLLGHKEGLDKGAPGLSLPPNLEFLFFFLRFVSYILRPISFRSSYYSLSHICSFTSTFSLCLVVSGLSLFISLSLRAHRPLSRKLAPGSRKKRAPSLHVSADGAIVSVQARGTAALASVRVKVSPPLLRDALFVLARAARSRTWWWLV